MQLNKERITDYFRELQDQICRGLELIDGRGLFQEDRWERAGGGGGRSRVMQGQVIEKGGVNFSAVYGEVPEALRRQNELEGHQFYATGVSIVLHPRSPMVPIIHMNVRYFEMDEQRWWFGGGIDLTPHYIKVADAVWFHRYLKEVCDRFHPSYYPAFKEWADQYFNLRHRGESRGVGGIFFDRLQAKEGFSKEDRFQFVQAVGEAFVPIYGEMVERNKALPYGAAEVDWQGLRRGRYVEFNLVWDRGTKFGLESDGRTESILMSMPPQAQWVYQHEPKAGTPEAETLHLLRREAVNWLEEQV